MKTLKNTRKSSILKQNFDRFRNFFLTAQQPKGQKSYSQLWLKKQLGVISNLPKIQRGDTYKMSNIKVVQYL